MYFLNYLKEIENIKLDLKHIDKVYRLTDIIKRSIDILINEYIKEWEKTAKVYLIDSLNSAQELIKNNKEL